jgi:hypothetical protein
MTSTPDMRTLINKIFEASANKLTPEFVTSHFNSKGFTAFEADGEKWYPKSASSKPGKDGNPILSLSWTTFDGKEFADAAYTFARVYVNPETNEVIKAQVQGTKEQVAGEKSREAAKEQLQDTIRASLEKDPELQKMRQEYLRTTKRMEGNPLKKMSRFPDPRLYTISSKEGRTSYELSRPSGYMAYDKDPNNDAYIARVTEILNNVVPGITKIKYIPSEGNIRFIVSNS